MKKLALVACFLAVFSLRAEAKGDGGGNAGVVVVCRDGAGSISLIELLDYYEAEHSAKPRLPSLGGTEVPIMEKVEIALSRMESKDPERYQRYLNLAQSFFTIDPFVDGPLGHTHDSDDFTPPPGCQLEQLCVQRKAVFPGDRTYIIDRYLWSLLNRNPNHQAGLILHEIIYGEMLGLGQTTSRKARALTSVISSDELGAMTQEGYNQLAAWAFAPEITPEFKSGEFELSARVGKPFSIRLRDLLRKPAGEKLFWSSSADLPSWLRLDSERETLSGTPSAKDSGMASFLLIVRQTKSAIAGVKINVVE